MLNKINSVYESKKNPHIYKNTQDYHEARRTEKLGNEKFAVVIDELSEEIQFDPEDFKLYFQRAIFKLKFGDIEGASKDFKLCEENHRNTHRQVEDYPIV